MNSQDFAEWLGKLPLSLKIQALAIIYSKLTIYSRELFIAERSAGKEKRVLEILHGLNEVHHTLSNFLGAYTVDETKAPPAHVLGKQLFHIEKQYRLEKFLTPAIESARAGISQLPGLAN
jgi:hypothetical protein